MSRQRPKPFEPIRSRPARRPGPVWWALALLALTALPGVAAAQSGRSILWVVDAEPGAEIDRERAAALFAELLQGADDANHIVDRAGLAEWIELSGLPVPECLSGTAACASPVESLAEELRLDVIAHVRVFGRGERMTLTVRGPAGGPGRTLQFSGDGLRATAFAVVSDFVGTSGTLTVTTRPTGASVLLDGAVAGVTPYQGQHPAGIYDLRIELAGHQLVDEVVELRPNQSRLVDVDLARLFADIVVRSQTADATVAVNGQPVGTAGQPFELPPGDHEITVSAPNHIDEVRQITVEAGEERALQIDLQESPESIRARRMGYIYNRPFFVRAGFRFSGTRSGFGEAEGTVGGFAVSVECPRSSSGGCADSGIPTNSVGLDVALGYSFKHLELVLLTFVYQAAQIGGSSGDGRTLTIDDGNGASSTVTGRLDGVQRIELRPAAIGVRFLLTDSWSVFGHVGAGWYSEFFEVDQIQGLLDLRDEVADFDRQGWNWMIDAGVRYHLNDTLFVEGSVALGDDFTHDDIDLTTTITAGLGITWEDFLGINRIGRIGRNGGGGDDGDRGGDAPPNELGHSGTGAGRAADSSSHGGR